MEFKTKEYPKGDEIVINEIMVNYSQESELSDEDNNLKISICHQGAGFYFVMETHIYDEKNGLSYTLHGDYYLPDLVLNEEEPIYGKYGMLRKQFLKEHRLAKYQYLLLTGKLTEHLNQIDQESREQVEMLMEQMAEKQGVTEELKVQDQMKWVGLMNNIKVSAEEIILKNMVYV